MIKDKQIVTLTYSLDVVGEIIEQATIDEPLVYCTGIGMMLPSFENKISLLDEDSDFDFSLTPDEALGERREDLLMTLDKSIFETDGNIDENRVFEGAFVPMLLQGGRRIVVKILRIGENKIDIDANHPFAGKTLHYTGHVVSVRPASQQEIEMFTHPHKCGGCGGGCHGGCDDNNCEGSCQGGCGGCD